MEWNWLLGLTIAGSVTTFCIVAWVIQLGIRYRRELPKLPIVRSIEALELQRDNLEEQLEVLKDDLQQARRDIEQGEEWKQWLEEKKPEIERTREDLTNLEREKAELDSVRAEKTKLSEEMEALLQRKSDLEKSEAEFATRLDSQREQIARLEALKAEQAELEKLVPELRSDLETARRRHEETLAELKESGEKLEVAKKEHVHLTAELESLKEQHGSWLEMIEKVKTDYSTAGGARDDVDPCEDLWKPVFPEPSTARVLGEDSERKALDKLEEQVLSADLLFAQRTLFAFHTALKIQGISPLTVLAGISGTGKSLIPKVYSECMGIKFLNLPVQPGWNSPLDLFGFYNYIEHKYKATLLSRALVQFDSVHRAEWDLPAENIDLSDQMLLILLDEMNLARIEYYFSELLSRLEIRRTIDPTDPEKLREVSVPLEIGHGSQKYERPIELYSGTNVLFAGTMNEDETTQSLADKVLDRACVLRFGRPRTMVTKPPTVSDLTQAEPLHRDTWAAWCSPRTVSSDVDDHIQELSDVMEGVGAPFGHRVSQAIRQYVALYPDSSSKGLSHAMADQVEQKMLPKIRGREVALIAEPLNRLLDLVGNLGDDALVDAIRSGKENEQGTFHWTGLDRAEVVSR